MIVGNGLIASAFSKAGFHSTRHVIFASGVSNSSETNPKAFEREITLVKNHLAKNTTFVYFSTTSVFDPSKQDSVYIAHKKVIEELIADQASSYLLVRLPIMVGPTNNPHTLVNYLVNAILAQRPIQLHKKACRHLLDIDDLVGLLNPYLADEFVQVQINIPGSEKTTIPDLVNKIENVLHTQGKYSWLDIGACYDIPESMGDCIFVHDHQYVEKILIKYYSNIKPTS